MNDVPFEKAFERLEEILQTMNEGKVSLDASLKLFEEANLLIMSCNKKLNLAEQKIEVLIKNQENVVLENDKPKTKNFEHAKDNLLDS
ncbi:MAG: Exodeoxyribonuclease 7 small subunit [Candidatus Anoxychlamydiales bacterium]|nr:Exodeoxyribonuclease 7 small subunit [Candidatus Anoxychlamydiales bacterium]NGX35295.1 Exodeoxyribonuclease 7 small subunit [Candidatus Anoxychlamydiales bacterium]